MFMVASRRFAAPRSRSGWVTVSASFQAEPPSRSFRLFRRSFRSNAPTVAIGPMPSR